MKDKPRPSIALAAIEDPAAFNDQDQELAEADAIELATVEPSRYKFYCGIKAGEGKPLTRKEAKLTLLRAYGAVRVEVKGQAPALMPLHTVLSMTQKI